MKELLIYLFRLKAFILFLFLEVVCFFLIVRYNNSQRQIFISSSNAISGTVYQFSDNIKGFFDLGRENESISGKNAQLLQQIYRGSARSSILEGELLDSQYVFHPARVINNSLFNIRNSVTLNAGSRHGVGARMGVITENGIVGWVQNVSKHYAKALSVLHVDVNISAKIKSKNILGSVQWTPPDYRTVDLKQIPKHYGEVAVGDTVVTSGYSTMFPANHPIGIIQSISAVEESNFYNIKVLLIEDLAKLDFVYIVENKFAKEIESLNGE
ncbi:rod shape-determining protein MreC [Winogradskyella sp.]|uniref:rod shape-determining protein MreC n=1 Tax=Winogradskyella sp. TaxID=1883156 RepID=UPI0037039F30